MIGDCDLNQEEVSEIQKGESCIAEQKVASPMKDTASPKPEKKKQTSLLSFFSSPSPKRPLSSTTIRDEVDGDQAEASSSSPIRKRGYKTSLLTASSPVYEMLSEEDCASDGFYDVVGLAPPKSPSRRVPFSVTASDIGGYCFDDSQPVAEAALSTCNPCKWGDASASGRSCSEERVEFEDEKGANLRDTSSHNSDERYHWLVKVRDAEGRQVDDPYYDPRTLYIPKSQWQKFTPFEKQFWEIKSKLFDTVVFFKKGKFYELYEHDADIGSREFDLKMIDRVNMRLVGVPEATFEMWAARFVAAGYKVARVDQTETSIGKSIREKENDSKAEKIIRRELSCILTAGTISEPSMLASDASSFCMAIKEINSPKGNESVELGIAIVDSSTGQFMLSSFVDDASRSTFETLLMQLQPKEIVLERAHLSVKTRHSIKSLLPKILITEAVPEVEFWSKPKIISEINTGRYFGDDDWPEALKAGADASCVSFLAFGALLWYLRSLKLESSLLSYCNITRYDPVKATASMVLDGQTLLNLDVVPNALRSSVSVADPRKGTLLGVVDNCCTAFGRRLMHVWLCNPLRSVEQINDRLDCVDFFIDDPGFVEKVRERLKSLPDLERALSRIHSGSIKMKDFIATLDAFKAILRLKDLFAGKKILPQGLEKAILKIPAYHEKIEYFCTSFDHKMALQEGQIIPFAGVEEDYDRVQNELVSIQKRLEEYLQEQSKLLRVSGSAKYRDIGKEIFQLEVPADTVVPKDFMIMSKTKTAKRYWTPFIREMAKSFQEWDERRNMILRNLYGKFLKQFCQHSAIWVATVQAIAVLDCLEGLAVASSLMNEPKCRPKLIDSPHAFCHMSELRHPCVPADRLAAFIPNDVKLGQGPDQADGPDERIILLTGPNMGGKSTLLRQTCLAIIMAQVGCYVSARDCVLAPVDRIFTRLGANDNIIAGQSTFMVELMDTSRILCDAGPRSLVILDELGRGTSTFDGMAIAHSTLLYLTRVNRPIGLFATHYRPLAVDLEREPGISCQYMSCALDTSDRKVTFLYKLAKGISPKSYGMNVAAMAGIPTIVIDEAEDVADRFDTGFSHSLETIKAGPSRALTNKLLNLLCLKALLAPVG